MNDPTEVREPLVEAGANTTLPTDAAFKLDRSESAGLQDDLSADISSAHQPNPGRDSLAVYRGGRTRHDSDTDAALSTELADASNARKLMLYQYPPQTELAKVHAQCVLYGCKQLTEDEASADDPSRNLMCRCCNTVRPTMLPLCKNPDELHLYGPMLPLYFNMLWFTIFLAFVMLVACVFQEIKIIKANCRSGADKYSGEPYPCKWYTLGTYINPNARNTDQKYYESDPLFMTWSILVFYFMHRMYVDSEKKMISDLRKKHPMISQFTVMVSNLSPEERTPEYVKEVLQTRCTEPLPEPLLYNFANRAGTKLGAINSSLADIRAKTESLNSVLAADLYNECTKNKLKKRIACLQSEAECLQKSVASITASKNSSSRMANGVVFVTFGSTSQKDLIKPVSGFWRALYVMFPSCHKKKVHRVEAAYDPDDVRWDKIGFTGIERCKQRFLMILLFGVGFGVAFTIQIKITIAILSIIRNNIQGGRISKPQLSWQQSMARSILFKLISVSNILSNYAISQLIKFISNQQHHISNTHSYMSRTLRMVSAQMIKTIAINTTIHYSMEAPTDYTILSEMVFNYFLMNIFMSPLLSAFRPSYLFKVYLKRWWVTRKLKVFTSGKITSPEVDVTQRDLNALYDPPMMDMPARYTGLYKTLGLAAYYLELVPTCALLTLVYLIVQYWADKYMILRKYCPPIRLNELYSRAMSRGLRVVATYLFMGRMTMYMDLVQWSNSSHKDPSTAVTPTNFALPALTLILTIIVFPIMELFGNVVVTLTDLLVKCFASCCCASKKPSPKPKARTVAQQQNEAASLQNSANSSRASSSDINFLSAQSLFDITYEQVNPMTKAGIVGN